MAEKEGISNDNVIEIDDIKIDLFKGILEFIYTGELYVNGDNFKEMLNAAKVYKINGLVDHCLGYIDRNAEEFIQSNSFLQMDQQSLSKLLERDQFMVRDETSIWNAALRWAATQCNQKGIEFSAKNCREMLGPALDKIRYNRIPYQMQNLVILLGDDWQQYYLNCSNDPRNYAIKGGIIFQIENFYQYTHKQLDSPHYSPTVQMYGVSWQIGAQLQDTTGISFFLQYSAGEMVINTMCQYAVTLRIVAQSDGTEVYANEMDPNKNNNALQGSFWLRIPIQVLNNGYNWADGSVTVLVDFSRK